jgi:hypothetical protein
MRRAREVLGLQRKLLTAKCAEKDKISALLSVLRGSTLANSAVTSLLDSGRFAGILSR